MQGRPQQGRDARFIEYLLRKDVGNKKGQLRTLQAVGTMEAAIEAVGAGLHKSVP